MPDDIRRKLIEIIESRLAIGTGITIAPDSRRVKAIDIVNEIEYCGLKVSK